MNKTWKIIIIALSAIILLFISWGVKNYFDNTHLVKETIDIGFQGAARQNNFLAAQRLAEYYHMNSVSKKTLPAVISIDHTTLLISLESIPSSGPQLDALRNWVQDGGHLICGAVNPVKEEDMLFLAQPLKDFLNIRSLSLSVGEEAAEEIQLGDEFFDVEMPLAFNCRLSGYQQVIKDGNGNLISGQRTLGDGKITLLGSIQIFNNDNLEKAQHAALLKSLLIQYDSSSFLLIYRRGTLSAWQWLWENAMPVIILLIALIVAWVLQGSRRFGPSLPPYNYGSRKIMEHIEAMGRYMWGGKHQLHLVKCLRRRIRERVKRVYPAWYKMSLEQLAVELSRISGLEKNQVVAAFVPAEDEKFTRDSSFSREDHFYETVLTLKKIRESI